MATIAQSLSPRKPVTHYALYGDVNGTAELLAGSGYLFRADGERAARLVHYADPELLLLGHVDLADAQAAADGDLVVQASRVLLPDLVSDEAPTADELRTHEHGLREGQHGALAALWQAVDALRGMHGPQSPQDQETSCVHCDWPLSACHCEPAPVLHNPCSVCGDTEATAFEEGTYGDVYGYCRSCLAEIAEYNLGLMLAERGE